MDRRTFSMIQRTEGEYDLRGVGRGRYRFERRTGELSIVETGACVGRFSCDPIRDQPFEETVFTAPGTASCRAIRVVEGEVMADIQRPENAGAYFVLPSQLNGAEYPSPNSVVQRIQDYLYDNTGGPRGQLAVHPAPGQFMLDNAASTACPGGINAIDKVLEHLRTQGGHGFRLRNGYLEMPDPVKEGAVETIVREFRSQLHTLRPLIMADIPAGGLRPSRQGMSDAEHRVGLVYASAVPVSSYMNRASTGPTRELHHRVAEAVLVAQYAGALSQIADRTAMGQTSVVYLMPLGGGVFGNPLESICKAISLAVEYVESEQKLGKLDIRVLAWEGNPREYVGISAQLRQLGKLIE